MRYRVYGRTSVTVVVEVEASSEEEAYEIALDQRGGLSCFCGNGGVDKLVGVCDENESVSVDDEITYDNIEVIE